MKVKELFSSLKNIPKPVLAVVLLVVMVIVIVPVFFFSGKGPRSRPPFPVAPQKKVSLKKAPEKRSDELQKMAQRRDTGIIPSVAESKRKEREILIKRGRYFSGIEGEEKKNVFPERRKYFYREVNLPLPDRRRYITGRGVRDEIVVERTSAFKFAQNIKEAVWKRDTKDVTGNLYALKPEEKERGENIRTASQTGNQGLKTGFSSEETGLPFELEKGKFYRAVIVSSVTSEDKNMIVMARLEGLRNAVLLGKIVGIFKSTKRLNVVFDKLLYNEREYNVKGIAYSLDRTQGIASVVSYPVLEKVLIPGILAFGEKMMDVLRKDTKVIVHTDTGTEIAEEKDSNRIREGALAGASASFGIAKQKTEEYYNQKEDVVVILEKGTPILVMFL